MKNPLDELNSDKEYVNNTFGKKYWPLRGLR